MRTRRNIYIFVSTVLLALMALGQLQAQPGRGGFGGFGGFGGGPPGGRGGPGGGGFSDFRQRMMERMDSNRNGSLEENEVSDRARGFVEGMARQAGVEVKYPLSIAAVAGGGSSRNRGRGSDRGRRGSGDEEFKYPLVASFGDESILGFGFNPNLLNGRVIDIEETYEERVISQLNRSMDRYDKDKSGVLEYEEWKEVPWQSDPRESDLDNDGRITRAEMAERYKNRGGDRGRDRGRDSGRDRGRGGDSGRGRDSGRGGSPFGGFGRGGPPSFFGGFGGGSSGGRGGDSGRGGRGGFDPTMMLRRFDQDGDGKIDMDQLDERVRGFASRMLERIGVEATGTIDINEVGKRIQQQSGGGRGGRSGQNAPKKKEVPGSKLTEGASQYGGSYTYRQPVKKPKDVPEWWDQRDGNEDGQITLAEYFTSRSTRQREREIDDFGKLDLNDDGIITPAEAASVEK